jgi:hypothetical protein
MPSAASARAQIDPSLLPFAWHVGSEPINNWSDASYLSRVTTDCQSCGLGKLNRC